MAIELAAKIDPVLLCSYLFGHDHWSKAADIIRSVLTPYSRTTVRGCHSSGKTFALADGLLVGLVIGADVVTTAPTDDQVRGQLWRNVHIALRDCKVPLSQWGEVNQTEIRTPTLERAYGRSTNKGIRFHGEHAREGRPLIVMVDEAPGVIGEVMNAIEGMRAGGDVRVVLSGNPLDPAGAFYDSHKPDSQWTKIGIGAFDTPNLAGLTIDDVLHMTEEELDDNVRPYLITRRYVKEKYLEWGPDDWQYLGRVLGIFPLDTEDSLFQWMWLQRAHDRRPDADPTEPVVAAIDVAGPGEAETVLLLRRGGGVVYGVGFEDQDPRQEVIDELKTWLPRGLVQINVDSVGIGHYFHMDLAKEFEQHGVKVRGVNVGRPSAIVETRPDGKISKKYANQKAEYFWHLRTLLSEGRVSGLPTWARDQLRTIKYAHEKGVVEIESKADLRKRGVASPDWAEATMLLYAPNDPLDDYVNAFGKSGMMTSTPDRNAPPGWEGAYTFGVHALEDPR